ncbi:hypothetical protein Enr13x_16520 [Stieleria neptunia]|uniref:Uncharacterized protein n=1 Tax=Stieleria neptunia TaxID=2527979 RepID=A0A518HLZ3_9BACT|nr:hypothetical protein Enr13x_16520 [Stieleria neptunia]
MSMERLGIKNTTDISRFAQAFGSRQQRRARRLAPNGGSHEAPKGMETAKILRMNARFNREILRPVHILGGNLSAAFAQRASTT